MAAAKFQTATMNVTRIQFNQTHKPIPSKNRGQNMSMSAIFSPRKAVAEPKISQDISGPAQCLGCLGQSWKPRGGRAAGESEHPLDPLVWLDVLWWWFPNNPWTYWLILTYTGSEYVCWFNVDIPIDCLGYMGFGLEDSVGALSSISTRDRWGCTRAAGATFLGHLKWASFQRASWWKWRMIPQYKQQLQRLRTYFL